jgi:2-oxoglutarate dehydrogenase E2 component (dihydrolipoamide succinyltransferase)
MGESIAEGTIVRWIKKVGDSVDRDEPLFEISTDKVDAEIPSPAAGVLMAIAVKEGETVAVNSVVATIGPWARLSRRLIRWRQANARVKSKRRTRRYRRHQPRYHGACRHPRSRAHRISRVTRRTVTEAPEAADRHKSSPSSARSRRNTTSTSAASGSGIGGRVTKQDILGFIDGGGAVTARPAGEPAPAPFVRGAAGEVVPMSVMRRKIAGTVLSKRTWRTSTRCSRSITRASIRFARRRKTITSARRKLTFTSFIAKVAVDCLRRHRTINASIDGDNIIYRNDINLIAVALENA